MKEMKNLELWKSILSKGEVELVANKKSYDHPFRYNVISYYRVPSAVGMLRVEYNEDYNHITIRLSKRFKVIIYEKKIDNSALWTFDAPHYFDGIGAELNHPSITVKKYCQQKVMDEVYMLLIMAH